MRHEAKDREDCESSNQAGEAVQKAQDKAVPEIMNDTYITVDPPHHINQRHASIRSKSFSSPVAVVGVSIVAPQRWQTATAD